MKDRGCGGSAMASMGNMGNMMYHNCQMYNDLPPPSVLNPMEIVRMYPLNVLVTGQLVPLSPL